MPSFSLKGKRKAISVLWQEKAETTIVFCELLSLLHRHIDRDQNKRQRNDGADEVVVIYTLRGCNPWFSKIKPILLMSDLVFMAEYTQVVQTFRTNATTYPPLFQPPNNSIPLVSHKPTLVRAYLSAQNVFSPATFERRTCTGKMMFMSPKGWITIPAANAPFRPQKPLQVDRSKLNDTMNFIVPSDYCKGQLDGVFLIEDSFQPDVQLAYLFTMKFVEVRPLEIQTVLVHYTGPDSLGSPVDKRSNGFDLLVSLDHLLRASPINAFVSDGCIDFDWNVKVPSDKDPMQVAEQSFKDLVDKLDNLRACSGTTAIYLGILPQEHPCGPGPANICAISVGSTAVFLAQATDLAVHEVGHILGRLHTPCMNDFDPLDNNYPYYFGLPRGSIGEVGVDLRSLAIKDPRRFFDVMSYCGPQWTSAYTYLHMLDALRYGASPLPDPQHGHYQDYQYTSFRISDGIQKANAEILIEFSILRTPPPMSTRAPDVILQLVDKKGRIVGSFPCTHDRPHGNPNLLYKVYHIWTPVTPGTDRIRILKADQVILDQRLASAPPRISSFKMDKIRGSSRMALRWQCAGAKNIKYSIRFSHDGRKWRALACGLDSTSFSFDPSLLPGGAKCTIQLLATAGFRTSRRNIEHIRLPIKPTQALINSPSDNSEYRLGEIVYLSGAGFSPNHGVPSPDNVYWTTDSQRRLGHGYQLFIADLPAGEHTIMLHVTNEEHGEVTAKVRIKISESAEPEPSVPQLLDSLKELHSQTQFTIQDTIVTNNHDPVLLPSTGTSSDASGNGCCCQDTHQQPK